MANSVSDQFVDYLLKLSKSGLSKVSMHQARRCLLDYIGVTLAGSHCLESRNKRYIDLMTSQGENCVIGMDVKTSLETAILINGINSHYLDLDDGNRYGAIHLGSPIISALLTFAIKDKVELDDVLRGIIVGYEAAVRLSTSVMPSHYNKGFHPTATCGTVGAAMGMAAMLNFDKMEMRNAFAASVLSASGTLRVIEDGSELKPYNSGRASVVGVMSALLAKSGYHGDLDPLEGVNGFHEVFTESFDSSLLLPPSTNKLAIEEVYFKPYASCRHTHPAIEASLKLKRSADFENLMIERIEVTTYDRVIGKHDHREVVNVASAKMSIPFCVAAALHLGRVDLEDFSEQSVNDQSIVNLCSKVTVISDDSLSLLVPEKRVAIVSIYLDNGQVFSSRIDYPLGEPENPITDKGLISKFDSLTTLYGLSSDEINKIVHVIFQGENHAYLSVFN